MTRPIRAAILVAAVLAAGCERGAATCESLLVTGAWVREAPPGADAAAGYFTAFNSGGGPVTLTGAAGPGFGRVAMHRTERVDGQMRMRPLERVTVPAGGKHVFGPGGDHLMLMAPRADFGAGDEVRLELRCGSGETRGFTAPVRRESPPEA